MLDPFTRILSPGWHVVHPTHSLAFPLLEYFPNPHPLHSRSPELVPFTDTYSPALHPFHHVHPYALLPPPENDPAAQPTHWLLLVDVPFTEIRSPAAHTVHPTHSNALLLVEKVPTLHEVHILFDEMVALDETLSPAEQVLAALHES